MERRKLLVTGCGRSGTLYASEVWKTQGMDVRHEKPVPPNGCMGGDGIASWLMAVDDPYPPYGPSAIGYEFDLVIHQVRHPLKVIASVAQFILREPFSRSYIERNAPETILEVEELSLPYQQQLMLQASRYWYYWNLLAEQKASVTVQVEKLTSSLEGLCELLNIPYRPGEAEPVLKTTNGRHLYTGDPYWAVDWNDINQLDAALARNIQLLAETYGYSN